MKCKVIVLGLTLVMALSLTGCGSKDTSTVSEPVGIREPTQAIGEEEAATGRIAFHVRYLYPSGKVAKSAVVDEMTAYVYEPDGTKITQADLEKVGGRGKASIAVAAGTDRRVDLVAYDGSLVSWLGSDTDVDVVAGQTTTAEIVMESTMPVLADLPDTNTTGAYTVRWGAAPGGTVYTLEENGTGVYTGADTAVGMADKREGSYAYRVKATIGGYGDSPWSEGVSTYVNPPSPEGTIDIDVPWPVDGDQPQTGDVATFALPGGATMEMVWVEPGTFRMGSPSSEPGRDSDEGPEHQVTISRGFYIGKYELTQGQWTSVMGTRPWSGQNAVQENPSNPAVYISWEDVWTSFITKLNQVEGAPVYRLPTEAEWEYACRAGTVTRWSFGGDESQLKDYAWYEANAWNAGEQYAHPVGTKLPNPWGLYDMHGNVAEWVQDWYDEHYYSVSPGIDPTGPATGSYRVYRGGNFEYYAGDTRAAFRDSGTPDYRRYADFGARLLRQGP